MDVDLVLVVNGRSVPGSPFLFTSRDGFNLSEGFGMNALCGGITCDAEAFLFVDRRTLLAMQPPAMAFA